MEKYVAPSMPTISHVLEDINDKEIVRSESYSLDLSLGDEELQNVYTCFYNCKKLQEDLKKHSEFKKKMHELNQTLQEKVESIKPQKKKLPTTKKFPIVNTKSVQT